LANLLHRGKPEEFDAVLYADEPQPPELPALEKRRANNRKGAPNVCIVRHV